MLSRSGVRAIALVLPLAVRLALPAAASVDRTQHFTAVRATAPPPGADFSSPAWKGALKAAGWYDITTKRPAPLDTTAYFLYDDKFLYVGFDAKQSGTAIIAQQTVDNAGIGTDDHVAFYFDTSGGSSRTYAFKVNPKGVHDESSSENNRYAPQWSSSARILPNGDYTVFMKIPLAIVRAQSSASQAWRMNFVRHVAGTSEDYSWAYDPTLTYYGSPSFWPIVDGIKIPIAAARPKPRADLYALGSAGSDRDVFADGFNGFTKAKARSLGIDVTVPLTNTLAFVGTLNPDFSNIEQDQTTIAPQEFQRNYSEYRPFFAQGSSYINALPNVGINGPSDSLLYTPSIGAFNRGLKVEGTTGSSSFGVLNVTGTGLNPSTGFAFNDSAFGYRFSRPDNSLGFEAEAVKAHHAGPNGCGFAGDCSDSAFGFGMTANNPRSGAFSAVRVAADRGSFIDRSSQANSLLVTQGFQTAALSGGLLYKDVGPEYNPIDGFTLLNDIRGPQGFLSYNGTGTGRSIIKSYNLTFAFDRFVDRGGQVHQADFSGGPSFTLKNQISIYIGIGTSTLGQWYAPSGAAGIPDIPIGYPQYTDSSLHGYHKSLFYNQQFVALEYKDGTPTPVNVSYSFGPFAGSFLQQISASTSQKFGHGVYGVNLEYDGNIVRALPGEVVLFNGYDYARYFSGNPVYADSQWLRRISLTRAFGKNGSLAVGLRTINGYGGFAARPGTNFAVSFHQRFPNSNELYMDYGTPASSRTLNRLIIKYVFHAGGAAGT